MRALSRGKATRQRRDSHAVSHVCAFAQVPLVLGLGRQINVAYLPQLQATFRFPQSLGALPLAEHSNMLLHDAPSLNRVRV